MGEFKVGQQVGTWSSFGTTEKITVKKEIGTHYSSELDAAKAIVKSGEQGVITRNPDGTLNAYAIDDGAYTDDLNFGEKVKASSAHVVDFIGDDATEIKSGQKIYPPTGADNGKVFRVFLAYSNLLDQIICGQTDQFFISDDIKRLQKLGYTVTVEHTPTKADFQEAMYDPRTVGFMWSGHGGSGYLEDATEHLMGPYDLEPEKVSPNLKMAVFESCETGELRKTWSKHLKQAEVIAWDEKVSNGQMQRFNSQSSDKTQLALDNLITKHLAGDFAKQKFKP